MKDKAEKPVSPGSTATGSGTSMGESDPQMTRRDEEKSDEEKEGLEDIGTTEADVSDGREQKQPRVD